MNAGARRTVPWRLLLSLAGIGVLWRMFAPTQLGGSLTYVTVRGTSMLPGIRTGDLVVVRSSTTYDIGDVVAYRSPGSPAPVLHRIVEHLGDRLLLKGDNNGFVDAYRPVLDDVIGRELLRLPHGTAVLELSAHPVVVVAAALTAAVCILVAVHAGRVRHRHRDRAGSTRATRPAGTRRIDPPWSLPIPAPRVTTTEQSDAMSGPGSHRVTDRLAARRVPGRPAGWLAMAAVAAVIAALAWTTPAHAAAPATRPVLVHYQWDYRAALPPNDAYDGSTIGYGDTVFLAVVDEIDVSVGWALADPDVEVGTGDLTLRAVVSSTAGWQRRLTAEPSVALATGDARSSMALDFGEALALARTVDLSTGVAGRLTVDVVAEADLRGTVAHGDGDAATFTGSSSSLLSFALTTNTATLLTTSAGRNDGPPATPSGGGIPGRGAVLAADASVLSGNDPYAPDEQDDSSTVDVVDWVRTPQQAANRLSFGPAEVDVTTARTWSTAALLAFAVAGLAGLYAMEAARRRGEAAVIAARYGAQLVPVGTPPDLTHTDLVDVESFNDLLHLARELERPVTVLAGPYRDAPDTHYFVPDGPTTYHYCARAEAAGATPGVTASASAGRHG